MDSRELLAMAKIAALKAAAEIGSGKVGDASITAKGEHDIVTTYDVSAQESIIDFLAGQCGECGFLAEEGGDVGPENAEIVWVIDPIDGSLGFSRQQPLFTVSIAASVRGVIEVGVIYDVMRKEMYSAIKGCGAFLEDRRLMPLKRRELPESIVGFDWGRRSEDREHALRAIGGIANEVLAVRSLGSAALSLAWVAAGRMDGYMGWGLEEWDVAAGSLIINEVGGRLIDATGVQWRPGQMAAACAAGAAGIAEVLTESIRISKTGGYTRHARGERDAMKSSVLLIMNKFPKAGRVKTRLGRQIGMEGAAAVAEALLRDLLVSVGNLGMQRIIVDTQQDTHTLFEKTFPGEEIVCVDGDELRGPRSVMWNAVKKYCTDDGCLFLLNGDTVFIDEDVIECGIDILARNDLVFGPCENDGLYLIGMKRPVDLFTQLPAARNPRYAEQTMEIAQRRGLSWGMTKRLYDVDTLEDIQSIRWSELRGWEHTKAVLKGLGLLVS